MQNKYAYGFKILCQRLNIYSCIASFVIRFRLFSIYSCIRFLLFVFVIHVLQFGRSGFFIPLLTRNARIRICRDITSEHELKRIATDFGISK